MYTDPFDPDTDNDGLSDGEELGEFVGVSEDGTNITNPEDLPAGIAVPDPGRITQGSYYRVVSNPVEVDTDGDGLTDFEEREEARPVRYTDDPDDTEDVMAAQRNDQDPSEFFVTDEDVYSNPYLVDSDFDGIDDFTETKLQTNPRSPDTDGDQIDDGEEFGAGEDPTLFDAAPPTVEIAALSAQKVGDVDGETFDVYDAEYTVRYRVSDPSGVTRTKVYKAGEEGKTFTGDDVPTERLDTVSFVAQSFSTFLAETSLGPQVRVQAEDVHGNADTTAQRGPNAFAKAAKVIDDLGGDPVLPDRIEKLGVVGFLAALSGFSYYIASTVDQVFNAVKFAVDIVRGKLDVDLWALYDAVAYLVDSPEVLLEIPGAIADSAQRAQALQNPFDPHPYPESGNPFAVNVDNVTFAAGWYLGGALGIAAEAFLTAGAASAGKAVVKGLPIVNRVIRAGETASALVAGTLGVAKQGALLTGRAIARGTGLALDVVTDAFRRVSVANQVAVRATIRSDVSDDVVKVAADGGFDGRLVRYLDVADDDAAARLLNALGGSDVADSRRLTRALLSEDTPDAFQRVLARQLSDGSIEGVDARRVLRRIDEASPADQQRLSRVVSEGGANGAKLLSRTDNLDAVKRFVRDPDVRDDAYTLIHRFDDTENLRQLFDLELSRADEVRANLARFSTDDQFSASRAEQFVEDTQVVKNVDGFDTPARPGGETTIDDMADAGDAGNLK